MRHRTVGAFLLAASAVSSLGCSDESATGVHREWRRLRRLDLGTDSAQRRPRHRGQHRRRRERRGDDQPQRDDRAGFGR